MLTLDGVKKTYRRPDGEVRALAGLSLEIRAGEFVAVQGPSGCGKTTLLLIAGGLLEPDEGRILLDGEDLYAAGPGVRARIRASRIGFVFQQFHLIPYLSVLDNVLSPSLAMKADGASERARELIAHFGLKERMGHLPMELSTGERQRTAMARALLNRPKILLADEPTGNLDNENATVVLKFMEEFAGAGGAVLLVTHHDDAAQYGGRILELRGGKL